MLEYLREFFDEYEYEMADRCAIAIAYDKIMNVGEASEILLSLIRGYEKDTRYIKLSHLEDIKRMATLSGVHEYTAIFLTLALLFRKMKERLLKLGLTKRAVANTILDLKWKIFECKKQHGVPGTENFDWYTRFLELRLFALGRLQYELRAYPGEDITVGERVIKNGAPVLYIHIPRDGSPLDMKLCNASFREAKKVFSRLLGIEDIPMLCASWLLYPKNRDFLPEGSNIIKFMDRFSLIDVNDCAPENPSVIKFIFNVSNDTKFEDLPEDSTLQRGYKAHLLAGGRVGAGVGVLGEA